VAHIFLPHKELWDMSAKRRMNMRLELLCPACGVRDLDFDDYEALVLLAPNLALMRFTCPGCGIHLSVTLKLTSDMQHRIQRRFNAEAEKAAEAAGCAVGEKTAEADGPAAGDKSAKTDRVAETTVPAAGLLPHDRNKRPLGIVPDPSVLSYASNLVVREGDPCVEFVRPLRVGSIEVKAHLEYFKRQLEVIETVDEAIEEIDTGYYHEKRDG
jgi:hypothetical protein